MTRRSWRSSVIACAATSRKPASRARLVNGSFGECHVTIECIGTDKTLANIQFFECPPTERTKKRQVPRAQDPSDLITFLDGWWPYFQSALTGSYSRSNARRNARGQSERTPARKATETVGDAAKSFDRGAQHRNAFERRTGRTIQRRPANRLPHFPTTSRIGTVKGSQAEIPLPDHPVRQREPAPRQSALADCRDEVPSA